MTNFEHMINYLASKGVKLIVKTEYKDNKPVSKSLMTKLTLTKEDKFYRVNGKIISGNMAKSLMRMA